MVNVKCFTCKITIDKKDAKSYTKEGQKTPKYFCNNSHLGEYVHKLEEEKQKKIELEKFKELDIYIASDILMYDVGQIVPPNLKRRIQLLNNNYPYEVIKLCFELMKEQLNYYIKVNEFHNEQHLVNYIMVVINNNINDAYLIWKRKKEIAQKSKKLEADLSISNSLTIPTSNDYVKKSKSTDISSFLMEDDL